MHRIRKKSSTSRLSLEEFLPYQLSVVTETISALLAKGYERQFGITIFEWRILAVIGEHGKLSTHEVIDCTRMDRVRVSRAVIRLAEKGLIIRTTNPEDARAHILDFSPSGSGIYHQIVPVAESIESKLAAALSQNEVRQLRAILKKLDTTAKHLIDSADSLTD